MPITPSPNRSRPPSFHELDENAFEEMTCALFEKEPGTKTADRFGAAFDKQYGIDVLAQRRDSGVEVASCKCYATIRKGSIARWSTDFLDHWETHWKDKDVRRFVLVVATDVNSTERMAEVESERARFRSIGVNYEVWAPRQLQEKLRSQPGIVSHYLGEEWVPRLCGMRTDNVAVAVPDSGTLSQLVVSQISSLQSALSAEVEERLDVAMGGIRRGDLQNVAEQLVALRIGTHWAQLRTTTQARVIRLQGSLCLQRGDLAGVERFSDEADAIAAPDEPRLRALLVARRAGATEGLRVLGDPVTRDGVQLKLALLLEAGRSDQAIELLDSHTELKTPNAETERLRAFVELFRGRQTDALTAVQRAEQMEPRWPAVRRAGAIVRYALALSPLATADWYLGLNPVDLDLVREDDEARDLLREALSRFEALVAEDVDPEMRNQDEAWALACLSNLRDRLGEAEVRCCAILSVMPTHALIVMWALARGFEIDRLASIQALRDLVDRRQADSQQALVLAWLLAAEERMPEAERVLQDTATLFDTPGAQAIRAQWLAEFAARQLDTATTGTPPQGSPSHQLARLIEQAQHTNDWTAVERFFQDLMLEATPPLYALPAARALAGARRWNAIAPHTDALLRFATAEAVRLAVHAAYRTGQPRRALQMLEAHRYAFPASALPNDLRAIEVEALHATGSPAAALRRASMLAAESPALADQMVKANVHLRTGNIRAALPAIRQATEAQVLSPSTALQLAQVVAMEDLALARHLWRHAKTKGIPDDLAMAALMQAFRFGIEHEAVQLFGVMANLAQQGTGIVRMASIDEAAEYIRSKQEDVANLQRLYFDGVVPVHLFVGRANINLAKVYRLSGAKEQPSPTGPFMIRHAARPLFNGVGMPITDWRIHLDITALLLASQLEILDYLERLPHPIAILPSVPSALQQLELDARPHQPRHVMAMREVLAASASGSIGIVEVPVEQHTGSGNTDGVTKALRVAEATNNDVMIVDHRLPNSPGFLAHRFTTFRAIVEGVHRAGALDATAYHEALPKIGEYAGDSGGTPPTPGATVLFIDTTFSVLAAAGLLDAVTRVYRVQVDAVLRTMAQEVVAQADRNEGVAAWLGMLRNRLAERLETGRYILSSSVAASASEDGADHDDDAGPAAVGVVRCLHDVVQAPDVPCGVVWADDRHLTGYQHNGHGHLLVGVTDVLQALRSAHIITDDRYFDALLRLRASGAMFIPLESEEVRYHLKAAPIVNDAVVETAALATLRRYVARALLLESHLKIGESPNGLEERPEETVFLVGLRRLAEQSVILHWKDNDLTDDVCCACSTWIWHALRVDGLLRQDLPATEMDPSLILTALQLHALLTGAIEIVAPNPELTSRRRKEFFDWVDGEVLGSRLDDDSPLAGQVIRLLAASLSDLCDGVTPRKARERQLVKRLLGILLSQYPNAIRRRLLQDANLCQRLEMTVTTTVTIGKRVFNAHRLWKAVGNALAYGRSHVRTTKGERRIIVRAVPGQEHTVRFDGDRAVLADPAFALLDRSPALRSVAIEKHFEWFDMPLPKREQAIRNVCAVSDPVKRIDAFGRLRNRSVACHYAALRECLKMREKHTLREFRPPAAPALLDHLRLPIDETISFADRLAVAAKALIADYDPVAAFARLASVPVAVPEPILQSFRTMAAAERTSALATVCKNAKTPLQLLHALFLFRTVTEGDDREVFDVATDRLLNEWRNIAQLFITVLKWTNAAYTHDRDWVELPAADRLALVWTHADRLTGFLLEMPFETDRVARDFAANHRQVPIHQLLRLDPGYHHAAASPDTIGPDCLLFHGLGYVLNGDPAISVLSSAQLDTVHNLITMESDGTRVISVWLLVYREAANNDLGSFFMRRPEGLRLDASPAAVSQTIDRVLRNLEADPMSRDAWPSVWALGNPALATRDRARLLAVLTSIDLVAFVKRDPDGIFLCRMVVDCWSRLNDRDSRPKILAQLERLGTYLATQHTGTMSAIISGSPMSAAQRDLSQLLEATALSARTTDAADSFARLGEAVVRLAEAWPNAAPLFRVILDNVIVREPALLSKALWKSLLVMRTY